MNSGLSSANCKRRCVCRAAGIKRPVDGIEHPRMEAHRMVVISILLFALVARAASAQESGNAIRAHIEGLHSDRGQVICALFTAANDFPKRIDRAFARTAAKIVSGRATCEFSNVPAGVYAVSVFHDENLNGRLDTNWLGIPREGVGASNNP